MEDWQREALRRHRRAILTDLHVDYVLDHLLTRQILFEEHKEYIFSKLGRRNRARHLLDLLPTLGRNAYSEFVESLQEPYQWLADLLRKESAETLTKGESSQSSDSGNGQNQQAILNPGELKHWPENVTYLMSTIGNRMCGVGDAINLIMQSSSTCVCRKNSNNLSENGPTIPHASKRIAMDRLRGGGDSEDDTVLSEKENLEIPPPSHSLLENSLDLHGNKPSKNIVGESKNMEGVAAIEKIIDSAYPHENSTDGMHAGGVICNGEDCEKSWTSLDGSELHSDLPDSGNTGDGDL
ncbi:uncharacterized protein [Hetaerina americana]|uniref:uncharacterized protein n=1 Tax=Hetaerina americana TaxID=62018 RepID=UPI003A7F16B9